MTLLKFKMVLKVLQITKWLSLFLSLLYIPKFINFSKFCNIFNEKYLYII